MIYPNDHPLYPYHVVSQMARNFAQRAMEMREIGDFDEASLCQFYAAASYQSKWKEMQKIKDGWSWLQNDQV